MIDWLLGALVALVGFAAFVYATAEVGASVLGSAIEKLANLPLRNRKAVTAIEALVGRKGEVVSEFRADGSRCWKGWVMVSGERWGAGYCGDAPPQVGSVVEIKGAQGLVLCVSPSGNH